MFRPASAAITFVGATSANNDDGTPTPAYFVSRPSTQAGDLMIAVLSARGGSATTATIPGFTLIGTNASGTTLKSSIFYKFATSSEPGTYNPNISGGEKSSVVISAYRGVDPLTPINVSGNQVNTSSATMTAPSVTTTMADTWVIAAFSTATGTTVTPGSSMTERGENASLGAGAGSRTTDQLQDITQAGAGSTGTKTATAGAAAINIGHTVALTPKLDMKMSAYRWFANADSTTPGTALAAQNTAGSVGAGPVRLQMLTHVEAGKTSPYSGVKLKYATRGADNVCDASGTNESYQDIMTRTKTKNAFAATAVNQAAGSSSWTLPAYAAGIPDSYTAYTSMNMSTPTSDYLKLTDLGFNVPGTATIHGVKITTNAWADTYDAGNDEIYLRARVVKGGTVQSTPSASQTIASTSTTNYMAFPSSMYGSSLTPTDVNSSTFGVALQADMSFSPLGNVANVGSVSVQVVYSDGGTVQFQDNATPTDGTEAVNGGLTHSTDPITLGSYNESNISSTQPNGAFQSSDDLLHDFSLNLSAVAAGTYCFMAFRDDGTALGTTHDVVPQLTVVEPTIAQANYRWYANANTPAPGAVLAAQDTPSSIGVGTPFRLRQRLAVDATALSTSGQSFKLQYAEKSGTCDIGFSGETYVDVSSSPISSISTYGVSKTVSVAGDQSYSSWLDESNAATDNAVDASVTYLSPGGPSDQMRVVGDPSTIPSNATITGFEVIIDGGSLGDAFLEGQLVVNGSTVGNYRTINVTSGAGTASTGSSSDMWGTSMSAATINAASSVGVELTATLPDFLDELSIDHTFVVIYYTVPQEIQYYNNASPVSGATITSSGNDPVNGARPTVYQTYNETDPFTNSVASVSSGSDGLWDIALTSDAATVGKTYCMRIVKSSGSVLSTYSYIPEITITGAGPSIDQMTRGGSGVIDGVKQNYSF